MVWFWQHPDEQVLAPGGALVRWKHPSHSWDAEQVQQASANAGPPTGLLFGLPVGLQASLARAAAGMGWAVTDCPPPPHLARCGKRLRTPRRGRSGHAGLIPASQHEPATCLLLPACSLILSQDTRNDGRMQARALH